tara:strand:+ start:1659 stop:2348 length:690 start_codon:yes stop_codon:yes gene_type:complete
MKNWKKRKGFMNKFVKHLTLLLLFGLALGQDSQDKLILKNGIEYLGRFEKKEEGVIFFKPAGDYSPQPIQENKVDTILIAYELANDEKKINGKGVNRQRKHNVSFGLFNEYTGFSVVGYNYNIKVSEMSELFFGTGTSILVTSLSTGIKTYLKKSKLSYYTSLAMDQSVFLSPFGFGFTNLLLSSFSVGLEYKYSDYSQLKFGGIAKIVLGKTRNFILPAPFLSVNFQF